MRYALHRRRPRAFTVVDLLGALAAIVVLLAIVLPALGRTAKSSMLATSFGNLMDLGAAHALYAAEWNGRQVQVIREEMSVYGSHPAPAFGSYDQQIGVHPPLGLGWGTLESTGELVYFAYRVGLGNLGNQAIIVPLKFAGPPGFAHYNGSFRLPNTKPLHDYVGGRFYGRTFYAPADGPVWDTVVENGCLDSPDEYVDCVDFVPDVGAAPAWSSYCLSPAALFHPNVMRHPADGGWQYPWDIDEAFETPGFFQARHPSLKTFMLEHNWVQNAPKDVCNPNFPNASVYNGNCEPYAFNHSIDSAPATLFYDLSLRLLPNTEAMAADQQVAKQTGAGLWSRDTPFGVNGYRIDLGYDGSPVSHHILTTEGILGRDTISVTPAR